MMALFKTQVKAILLLCFKVTYTNSQNSIQFPAEFASQANPKINSIYTASKVKNVILLSSQVTLLILGFCTVEKNGRILSSRQQQKMPRQVH